MMLRHILSLCVAALFFAGCGGAHLGNLVPDRSSQSQSARRDSDNDYAQLYSFTGGTDGGAPSRLTALGDELYGTTAGGGTGGYGSLFVITPQGDESVIYSFEGSDQGCDGLEPSAPLVAIAGLLYGTTAYGGCGYGTVFSASPSGSEKVLHRFKSAKAGLIPGALTAMNGMLYGVAQQGGEIACERRTRGCGTVFAMSASGKERVLYRFARVHDGSTPNGVITINGQLYGTTRDGGRYGHGAVFTVNGSGHERVLYSFKGGADGASPQPGLVNVKNVLYGTTALGGVAVGSYLSGAGTLYSVDLQGNEKIIHSFSGDPDGMVPNGMLVFAHGALYGTTMTGGSGNCYGGHEPYGCGTVFDMSTSGEEKILHSFEGPPDGYTPATGLTMLDGTFYGTTSNGGNNNSCYPFGCGTVFKIDAK
jgi:uncharacterized repeat protein (TIGR03803 family)